jgi:hypothetical protein
MWCSPADPARRRSSAIGRFGCGSPRWAVCRPTSRPMYCVTASPVSGYKEPTIASLLGHKTHSITSGYMHSADAVLLAAADAVANATMKLMASDSGATPIAGSATR